MNTPQYTLSQITKSLATADTFSWWRGDGPRKGELTIYYDDVPADRREIVKVKFKTHAIEIERKRLTNYDPKKHCWNAYAGQDRYELPTRAGEKALRAILTSHAKAITGYPNPTSFSWYKL